MRPVAEIICFTPPPSVTVYAAKMMLNVAVKTLVVAAIHHDDLDAWELARRHLAVELDAVVQHDRCRQ